VAGVFALLTDITPEAHASPPDLEAPVEDTRARLASALERDEFTVQLQAIASLRATAPETCLEQVSLRMNEEEAKHLPPGGFIALAEELGMLHEIDRWLVRHAIDLAATRDSQHAPIFVVSLSCAGAAKADFPDFVRECLERRAVPGGALCFELAEDDLMAESATCRASLVKLAAAGVRFCAAGVGRDLRRIARLKALGMDYIKIDGGIVLDMLRSPGGLGQVKAISQAAHAAGLVTIADCVETDCARAALARVGIRYAQGTAVAQPRCADEPISERSRKAA
jgi:Amt family ammonium transporter